MADEKKSIVSASMIDLKAELFRKQEEFKRQKATSAGYVRAKVSETKDAKVGIWSQQNPGVAARANKDLESKSVSEEDEELLARSRRILEEKSRLYDKITNSSIIPEEDGSEYYLVDFQKKAIDAIVEKREAARRKEEEEEEERLALAVDVPEPSDPDEEWVDFTDSLGRDRRCMKKDLDQLMKKDKELALSQVLRKTKQPGSESTESSDGPDLMSSDMHRELMRQKWEAEAKDLMEKGQNEIHYSNVQFDEIRAHGVGFYQFSKDHEKREDQLEGLKQIHKETLDERSHKDQIKDKRKAKMETRLAKVRERRKIKGEVTEEVQTDEKEEEMIGPKLTEATIEDTSEKAKKEKEAEEKRKNHVREWDKNKRNDTWDNKNYVEKCRAEREEEFAPPSMYFDQPKAKPQQMSDHKHVKRLQASLKNHNPDFAPHDDNWVVEQIPMPDISNKLEEIKPELLSAQTSEPPFMPDNKFFPTQSPSLVQTVVSGYWRDSYNPGNDFQSTNVDQQGSAWTVQYPQNCTSSQFTPQSHYLQAPVSESYSYSSYDNSQAQQQFSQQSIPAVGPHYNGVYSMSYQEQMGYSTDTSQLSNHVGPQSLNLSTPAERGTKRQYNTKTRSEAEQPKIPKMAIVDTRFVRNDIFPSANDIAPAVPIVEAVPYIPGSFTAAKQQCSDKYEESVAEGRLKSQLSGSPVLYTTEQQQQQQKQILEEDAEIDQGLNSDSDKKLQDFLSSIRSDIS